MKLRNFPNDTPKVHFAKLGFILYFWSVSKVPFKSTRFSLVVFFLDDHIIFINLHVLPNILVDHLIYQPLVCGPSVL